MKGREPLPSLNAVYFIQPTADKYVQNRVTCPEIINSLALLAVGNPHIDIRTGGLR